MEKESFRTGATLNTPFPKGLVFNQRLIIMSHESYHRGRLLITLSEFNLHAIRHFPFNISKSSLHSKTEKENYTLCPIIP